MFGIAPDKLRIEGFAGKKSTVPIYIQFVTGYCSDVCHHSENIFHEASNHTNTIMAIPHQTDKNFKTNLPLSYPFFLRIVPVFIRTS